MLTPRLLKSGMSKSRTGLVALLLMAGSMLLVGGCSSSYVKASNVRNPPPLEPFRNFDRFEIQPIAMQAPYAGQAGNESARQKMQSYIDEQLVPQLQAWNAMPPQHSPVRVLRIEPQIRDIRFIHGAARILAGGFAGSSAVIMDVKFSDAATGAQIARPEFYSHAYALAGAYSFGVADNVMLIRPPTLLTEYVNANYVAAVGGRNSAEEPK